ncbi:MAG: J domain-containing protein, partial [bacterium]|nr:J domain-containing protein [bacterium]
FDFGDILKEFGFGGGNFSGDKKGGFRFSFGNSSPFGFDTRSRQQAQIKGSDIVYELPLTLQEVLTGTRKMINFQHEGRAEKLTVKIPKGMITGKKLRLAGKGTTSPYGGPSGDLYIKVKVVDDPVYGLKGHDLYINREVKLSEAILGTRVSIPILDGKKLSLKIPPGTKHMTKMRISGRGLPHMNSG